MKHIFYFFQVFRFLVQRNLLELSDIPDDSYNIYLENYPDRIRDINQQSKEEVSDILHC